MEIKMLKSTLLATLVSVALLSPAFGQELKCDDATIAAMESEMYKMSDAKAKQSAMEDLILAMRALVADNKTECLDRLQKAEIAMKKT